ncbi:MAG: 3-methyl-2-oxobutanoate hydroxymethyltransferase [Verrucomicrobiota bacterium]
MKSVLEFRARKAQAPISMVAAHTHWEARLLAESPVDCVLVGDSLATVIDGEATTFAATPDIMARHVAAVARGLGEPLQRKLLVGDFPFLAARKGTPFAVDTATLLLRAGAQAVKIEGVDGHAEVIFHLVQSGVPVMGHLGLTPQSVHAFGGYKVQGRDSAAAADLVRQARALEAAGVFGLVLECVPEALAREITAAVAVPTIGIGAGSGCDGQVLVMADLLGLSPGHQPRFVRHFAEAGEAASRGLAEYHAAVSARQFPSDRESY